MWRDKMWCIIYATFWTLWTHKPTIKLAGRWENCCQGMCINILDSTYVTGEGNMQSVFLDVKLRL
jgi:hypothetical protein